jgi:translation initiation factor 5A
MRIITLKAPMLVRPRRFRVKPGKSKKAGKWNVWDWCPWEGNLQWTSHSLNPLSISYFFRYMMIKGFPCKVLNISVSKTGKHGHAKCNFTAVDIFTGKKLEDMIPSSHGTTVPIVNKTDWEIINIDGEELTMMDEAGNQKTDLNLPTYPEGLADEIRNAWNGGESQVMVSVQAAVGIEQIVSFKKD